MTPPDYIKAAEQALKAVKSDFDLQIWHETWATGESYICLPDAEAGRIDALYGNAVQRVWGVEA